MSAYNTGIRKKGRGTNLGPRRGSGRPLPDKSVLQEGIYINERFMYTVASLIGCTAQVKVRNGKVFEGIIKTTSPKFQVVLEKAHVVDPSAENGSLLPSRDQIIHTIIFDRNDIVTVTFVDVNLDYAVTDSFTDAAISNKCNGQAREKELEPWVGDALDGDSLEGIEDVKIDEQGWDVQDMFQTNADKFNIKSDYDPSLSQYTTPLNRSDTDEYRQREVHAQQLAYEIERGRDSKVRNDIENGDEEMNFSAVIRPGESHGTDTSSSNLQRVTSPSSNAQPSSSGKYVAPHMRQNMPKNVSAPLGGTAVTPVVTAGAVQQSPTMGNTSAGAAVPKPLVDGNLEARVNGNDEQLERLPADMMSQAHVSPHQPHRGAYIDSRVKHDTPSAVVTATSIASTQQLPGAAASTMPSQQPKQNNPKAIVVEDLRTFHSNFKLSSEAEGQERKLSVSSAPTMQQQPQQPIAGVPVAVAASPIGMPNDVIVGHQQQQQQAIVVQPNAPQHTLDQSHHLPAVLSGAEKPNVLPLAQQQAVQQQQQRASVSEQGESSSEVIKKSTLNPFAKEFNPTAKPMPVPVMPSSTPPRPISVPPSPVSTYPTPLVAAAAPAQAMYQSQPMYVQMHAQPQGQRFQTGPQNKRVTVSARGTGAGEINQAQQATVMAGAPLITAQPVAPIPIHGQGHLAAFPQQFIPFHAPAPGYSPFQMPMVVRPMMPVGQHDPASVVLTATSTGVFLPQTMVPVHLSHPHPASQMASQQTPNAGNSAQHSAVPQPPASGHQTPTPTQLQPQFSIQPLNVIQATASGTPQPVPLSGPSHGAAAAATYHPVQMQHPTASVLQHPLVMQQQQTPQQGGSGNAAQPGGLAPQSSHVVYSSMPLHYAPHQITYVPAVASASQATPQGQQGHGMNPPPPQQAVSQAGGQQSGTIVGTPHALHPAHLMMQQAAGSSQHSVHGAGTATSMPLPSGPGAAVAAQMLIQGQPPQPGVPAGVSQPTHQYVQAHQIQGPAAMAQGHIIPGGPQLMSMYAMQQGPPQVHSYQHGPGPQ